MRGLGKVEGLSLGSYLEVATWVLRTVLGSEVPERGSGGHCDEGSGGYNESERMDERRGSRRRCERRGLFLIIGGVCVELWTKMVGGGRSSDFVGVEQKAIFFLNDKNSQQGSNMVAHLHMYVH